ncbi:MAG: Glu-tRNA(Gln) amidotransferase subunit GatE, partial [Candidatus Pacearchaeota archaeon]
KYKLFCNCLSVLRQEEPDFTIKRKLHAVAGEEGSVDVAAEYQAKLEKEFFYQGYEDTTCLVELDEEPCHEINKEALKIALHISLLMNCNIIPITQIMRKTVIDGSNTSGFQRSVLIARDGFVETKDGKVGILYVYLEEDAARKISDEGNITVYRLDRLGIPLVEIVTAPDIKTPEQAKDVALYIGKLLRACKVKRGLGTIRQDINVSIEGHPRVEIKGFQDPKIFVKVVEEEIERQIKDLESGRKNLAEEVRGANPDGTTKYLRPLPGSARMYPETDLPILSISKKFIDEAKRTLPKINKDEEDLLKKEGLNSEMVKLLFKENKLDEYRELLNVLNKPKIVAKMLLVFPKEISSHEKIPISRVNEVLTQDILSQILDDIKKGKIKEDDIKNILKNIVKTGKYDLAVKSETDNFYTIEEKIIKIIKEKPGLSLNAYMGLVMKEFKGKVSGKEAAEIIKKHMK